jgi:hypothetical protein
MDFSEIKKRIQNNDVKIVAVTKNQNVETIQNLPSEITCIGENRIQEAEQKFLKLNRNFEKHFVGHLQSNKVKKAIHLFDCIQSVDSLKIAKKINQYAPENYPIMLQVNISNDPSKYGFQSEKISKIIPEILKLENINLIGLMTIGEQTKQKKYFRHFKKLFDECQKIHPIKYLSMGMSKDYEIAIEEGSNMIRLGRILFSSND